MWIVNGSLAVGVGRVACSGLTVRKWTGPSELAAAIEKNTKGAVIFPQTAMLLEPTSMLAVFILASTGATRHHTIWLSPLTLRDVHRPLFH